MEEIDALIRGFEPIGTIHLIGVIVFAGSKYIMRIGACALPWSVLIYCFTYSFLSRSDSEYEPTRDNSADSVPTSNLVCAAGVAIRTTLCIAGII